MVDSSGLGGLATAMGIRCKRCTQTRASRKWPGQAMRPGRPSEIIGSRSMVPWSMVPGVDGQAFGSLDLNNHHLHDSLQERGLRGTKAGIEGPPKLPEERRGHWTGTAWICLFYIYFSRHWSIYWWLPWKRSIHLSFPNHGLGGRSEELNAEQKVRSALPKGSNSIDKGCLQTTWF